MSPKLQTVHVRINDAATGKPTPCRVRFTDAGRYYAPLGRLDSFSTDPATDVGGNLLLQGKAFAYIDGACEIELPPCPLTLEVHKGPEYRPLLEQIQLITGKMSLRLEIARWFDGRARGWYAGDVRAHHLSPHAALLEGAAEDLAIVNLLATASDLMDSQGKRHRWYPNLLEFSGQEPALESAGTKVVVNTYNASPSGNLCLLHCHRIVFPLSFENTHWSLADWVDQCHRKKGLALGSNWEPLLHDASEARALVLDGRIDGLEVTALSDEGLKMWYDLLNHGVRIPIVGGSGKDSNKTLLGSVRTYALFDVTQPFSYAGWIEALRAGRVMVTNGPILEFEADGNGPGSRLPGEQKKLLRLHAKVRGNQPLDKLQIVAGGEVVAETPVTDSLQGAVLDVNYLVEKSCWLAARAWGPIDPITEETPAAHTAPIYFQD